MVLQENSFLGTLDALAEVPRLSDGLRPSECGLAYPMCIGTLVGAGNEALPGGQPWNKEKSSALLRFYSGNVSEVESDVDSDAEKSRRRRVRLARRIGVTQAQLVTGCQVLVLGDMDAGLRARAGGRAGAAAGDAAL